MSILRVLYLAHLLAAVLPCVVRAEPAFVALTATGREIRGPLLRLGPDWSVEIGKPVRRRIAGDDLLSLRREGQALPAFPTEEHLLLASGDRIPFRNLSLKDEKLSFTHPDLGEGEASAPLSAVSVIWRNAPDRTVSPEALRRQLLAGSRSKDRILLRNGDVLEGTLGTIADGNVEVEINRKTVSTRWPQVAAIALSTELADRPRPKGLHARVVLTRTAESPGGRFTLTQPSCDGVTFRGRTLFGAIVRAPLERVVGLDLFGGRAASLSELKPVKYVYRPWLDERWSWSADASAPGRDLRVGGATYERGIGMHASSSLTWSLKGGGYSLFTATVGLDDLDGIRGRVQVRVLVDGKPPESAKPHVLTHAGGPIHLQVKVDGAGELTLEVLALENGPVQGVVNWVDARLVK